MNNLKLIAAAAIMAFVTTSKAEMKLESSEIVIKEARMGKKLSDGRTIKIFPATIKLIEVDNQNGAVRETEIEAELNQIKTPKFDMMIMDDPVDAAGPWMLFGFGYGRAHMKITGLRDKSVADMFDRPFKGHKMAFGFGFVSRNISTTNSQGVQIIDPTSKGVGIDISDIEFTLSSQNSKVKVNQDGRVQENMNLESFMNYRFK